MLFTILRVTGAVAGAVAVLVWTPRCVVNRSLRGGLLEPIKNGFAPVVPALVSVLFLFTSPSVLLLLSLLSALSRVVWVRLGGRVLTFLVDHLRDRVDFLHFLNAQVAHQRCIVVACLLVAMSWRANWTTWACVLIQAAVVLVVVWTDGADLRSRYVLVGGVPKLFVVLVLQGVIVRSKAPVLHELLVSLLL